MSLLRLDKIAEMVNGKLVGDGSIVVESISAPEKHIANSISPFWEKKFLPQITPGMVLLTQSGWMPDGCSGVEAEDPRRALVTLLEYFEGAMKRRVSPSIHPTAVVADDAVIGKDVHIGPHCVVSSGAVLGDGCRLIGGVFVGNGAKIGEGALLEYGVVLYDSVTIGRSVIIHANAVIGCDGFGFMPDPKRGLLRIPQIGTVVIGDNVEIGVGTAIDRATFGETRIGNFVKIDAHVKIGHNCSIGDYTIIVAQAGIAGSSNIGSGVTMAARSAVVNHASVGDGVTIAGGGVAVSDVPAGSVVSGFPAVDHKQDLKQQAAVRQLPELIKRVKRLEVAAERLAKTDAHA